MAQAVSNWLKFGFLNIAFNFYLTVILAQLSTVSCWLVPGHSPSGKDQMLVGPWTLLFWKQLDVGWSLDTLLLETNRCWLVPGHSTSGKEENNSPLQQRNFIIFSLQITDTSFMEHYNMSSYIYCMSGFSYCFPSRKEVKAGHAPFNVAGAKLFCRRLTRKQLLFCETYTRQNYQPTLSRNYEPH